MRSGALVLWTTPGKCVVLGLVLREVMGHGGGATGWWRVLADAGAGMKTHLTRVSHLTEVL